MKTQHTPGPWWVDKENPDMIRANTKDSGEVTVAVCRGWDSEWKTEERANASLIAAAPDLLEALRILVGCTEKLAGTHGLAIDNARAALNKATGGQP